MPRFLERLFEIDAYRCLLNNSVHRAKEPCDCFQATMELDMTHCRQEGRYNVLTGKFHPDNNGRCPTAPEVRCDLQICIACPNGGSA